MTDCFYLAFRYLSRRPWGAGVLTFAIALTAYFPMTLHFVLGDLEKRLLDRADATPLVVGAKGSRNDLALHALYFRHPVSESTSFAEFERIEDTGRADAFPLLIRQTAKGYTVVGTTLEYLNFRNLLIKRGRLFRVLGECVVGSAVARDLGIEPGNFLVSDPSDGFGLTGEYPLKLLVTGTLVPSGGPDDEAVFVDVKTAWVMEGIGHGHDDLEEVEDAALLPSESDEGLVANASLRQFTEITEENMDRFHFHGDPGEYPLTAIIAAPRTPKDEAILRGRYVGGGTPVVLMRARDVVGDLLDVVLDVKGLFDRYTVLTGLASIGLVGLIVALSVQLRHRELQTMDYIGCSRARQCAVVLSEVALIACMSGALSVMAVLFTLWNRDWLMQVYF